jgi:sulfite exporter TauE/SafE
VASVNSGSSFVSFLLFGLIAGVSTCAALVGGLVLSLSDGWDKKGDSVNFIGRMRPHVEFNMGRLFSYGFFGVLLGLIGEKMNISVSAPAIIVIIASLIMVAVGLKMLGIRMPILSFSAGKSFSKKVFGKAEKLKKYAPAVSGFLTFFLPCGFTIASQGAALASGSPLRGGLIMFFFALGTVPSLFAIGVSKAGLSGDRKKAAIFSATAGFLLLIFSVYNVNNQLNVLGVGSLNDVFKGRASAEEAESIGSESQVIRMEAYSYGYKPDYFTVKAGVPVRWEIKDMGTSGCTNAVIARDLFKERIPLYKGKTSVVEFTPKKPGKYKFSCWMGMIRGIIEVK